METVVLKKANSEEVLKELVTKYPDGKLPNIVIDESWANRMFSFPGAEKITSFNSLDLSKVKDASFLLNGLINLKAIKDIDTKNIENMTNMFGFCRNLEYVPSLDTSSAKKMSWMFANCLKLNNIPDMDSGNVSEMIGTFYGCKSLVSAPKMNTKNVKNMNHMFNDCLSLAFVPDYDTSNVEEMRYMFESCGKLKNAPNFNTGKVWVMNGIFYGCKFENEPKYNMDNVKWKLNLHSPCFSLVEPSVYPEKEEKKMDPSRTNKEFNPIWYINLRTGKRIENGQKGEI